MVVWRNLVKTYPVERIRNVGLFSHGGAGKTSLSEAMLYSSKAISRLGRVEDGNTVSDWDPEEARRSMSISTSILPIEWRDHKINLLDTPGYADFVGEVKCAMRVVDLALILVDASAGAEVGTEYAWRFADEFHGSSSSTRTTVKMPTSRRPWIPCRQPLGRLSSRPTCLSARNLPSGASSTCCR
jgi:small GTP-binding protein